MNRETYQKMTQPFRDNPKLAKSIHILNKLLTGLVFASYPVLLLYLLWNRSNALYMSIVVPLDGFLIVSAFRYLFNRRRPYERFDLAPVIPKDTKGSLASSGYCQGFITSVMWLQLWCVPELVGCHMVFGFKCPVKVGEILKSDLCSNIQNCGV